MTHAIVENGVVTNVIAGDVPGAVPCENRAVRIGDTYAGGKFFREGAEVLTPMEELNAQLEQEKALNVTLGAERDAALAELAGMSAEAETRLSEHDAALGELGVMVAGLMESGGV